MNYYEKEDKVNIKARDWMRPFHCQILIILLIYYLGWIKAFFFKCGWVIPHFRAVVESIRHLKKKKKQIK